MKDVKSIKPVLSNTQLIDSVLSNCQKRTPTIVRKNWQIPRIREFYLKKIKFLGNEYLEQLGKITVSFPRLEEIHPFYGDLINVLYDKNTYKKSLGHVNSIKKVIKEICSEYLKLTKYGNSLYRCKQLKISCFGRMTSAINKLKPTFEYLEEVRQHMSRLPDIDPVKRTVILCGLPNVGKSSLMKKLSNTKVSIQNYAFTTKSLYVGHFEKDYIPWQILDTPGVLDHPVSEMNNIELQTVTALAHLKSVVVFIIDPTEECGYPLEKQINLLDSLGPMLNSEIVVSFSKADVNFGEKEVLKDFVQNRKIISFSAKTGEGIEELKKTACDALLMKTISEKLKQIESKISMIDIKQPKILAGKGENRLRTERIKTEKEFLKELGEDYIFDKRKFYLTNEEEKYDRIPEFFDGKNISDFVGEGVFEKVLKFAEEENRKNYSRNYDLMTKEQKELIKDVRSEITKIKIKKENKGKTSLPEQFLERRKQKLNSRKESMLEVEEDVKLVKKTNIPVRKFKYEKPRYFNKYPKHLN